MSQWMFSFDICIILDQYYDNISDYLEGVT